MAIVFAAWRGLVELLVRRRELHASGELDRRVEQRRALRIERALARSGVRVPARAAVLGPIRATVHGGSTYGTGSEDVGLLGAAMRRTAAKPPLVTYVDDRSNARDAALGELLDEHDEDGRARRGASALSALPLPMMVLGVALTFYPLVRPLSDVAPWFALVGLVLVGAGALGARWLRAACVVRDGTAAEPLRRYRRARR